MALLRSFLLRISARSVQHGVQRFSCALTSFSQEEQSLRNAASKFAKERVSPLVPKMEAEGKMDPTVIKGLFENGFMGAMVPERYGGAGASMVSTVIIVEELSKVDGSVALACDAQNTLVTPLLTNYGNDQQKEEYLPKLTKDMVRVVKEGCAVLEESSGSDAFALKTTAKQDGSDYVINGSKMWITSASMARVFFVMANADPPKKYKGITCFIVDVNSPGLTVAPAEDKLGLRASSTCQVFFDNVRVPASSVLGEVGKGYRYAIQTLNEGRIGIAAQMIGIAQGCLDNTIPYLMQRKQFGTRIFDFQSIRHQIADVVTKVEAARLLTYNAARLRESGQSFVKQASMAKLFASHVAGETTSMCVDWMGGVGIVKQYGIEKYYRDCKSGTIYEGTSNIQRDTIAELLEREYQP